MKICFGYFETQDMKTEGNTNTQIASLIPFSARCFKKTALKTKVDQIGSIKDTPLIGFQVKIISYRKVACTMPFSCARIRFNRKITSL